MKPFTISPREVVNGIPRFVPPDNYARDFGQQWNLFPTTQLDSVSGLSLSEERLSRCLRGELSGLAGKLVLEAGSGAGRFTEILLKHGAIVHSFDYSNAVEANALNNGSHENLTLAQADIREMPFEKTRYDYVICLGVLQHTPSPEESIGKLWEMVKPGGRLVFDHYRYVWKFQLPPPFGSAGIVYRWLALKLPPKKRFGFVKRMVDFWFPIHWNARHSLLAQRIIRRFSPVHFYYPDIPLKDRQMFYEWALLDTHDSTTDHYKHLRSPEQIRKTLMDLGAQDIHVSVGGNGVEAWCVKP
jgi:SAM-dependent methyltransferase